MKATGVLLFLLFQVVCEARPQSSAAGATSWQAIANLAEQRMAAGDLPAAEQSWRDALALAQLQLGEDDKQLAVLLTNLGGALHLQGRDRDAYSFARRALHIAEASGDARLTAATLNGYGLVLTGAGEFALAESFLRRSLKLSQQAEGPDTLDTARAENNLAGTYLDTDQNGLAEPLLRHALPIYERDLGPDDISFAIALGNMFNCLLGLGRYDEAEPFLRRALAIGQSRFPGTSTMAHLQVGLAGLEFRRGNLQQSARILQTAIALQERTIGPEHPELARTLGYYSIVMRGLHHNADARQAENRASMILKRASLF